MYPLTFIIFQFFVCSQDVDVLIDAGYDQYLEENYDSAIVYFDRAAEIAPDNPEIYYLRGVSKSSLGNKKGAMQDLETSVALKPDYAEAYYEIGFLFITDRNAEEAIKAFDKAIKYKDDFAEAYVSRGTAKCMSGNPEGATEDWEKAQELGIAYSQYMVCE